MAVEQGMECLGPLREFRQRVLLQRLREAIVEGPDIPDLELLMSWLAPLLEHGRNRPVGEDPDVRGSDHEVVSYGVIDLPILVSIEPLRLIMPFLEHAPDTGGDKTREITDDEAGVLSRQFDLTGKRQIVANHDTGPGDDASRECLVMAVPDSENPAVIVVVVAVEDFHQPEVPGAVVGEAMGGCSDSETVCS